MIILKSGYANPCWTGIEISEHTKSSQVSIHTRTGIVSVKQLLYIGRSNVVRFYMHSARTLPNLWFTIVVNLVGKIRLRPNRVYSFTL